MDEKTRREVQLAIEAKFTDDTKIDGYVITEHKHLGKVLVPNSVYDVYLKLPELPAFLPDGVICVERRLECLAIVKVEMTNTNTGKKKVLTLKEYERFVSGIEETVNLLFNRLV